MDYSSVVYLERRGIRLKEQIAGINAQLHVYKELNEPFTSVQKNTYNEMQVHKAVLEARLASVESQLKEEEERRNSNSNYITLDDIHL